jgi:hypothetical protein
VAERSGATGSEVFIDELLASCALRAPGQQVARARATQL